MANEEHLAVLGQGVDAWNQWRKENRTLVPDLSDAILTYADLSGADLSHAKLSGAGLLDADLAMTLLISAILISADLSHADLGHAALFGTSLVDADLSHADLSHADLTYANLSYANLSGAILSHAELYETVFGNVNLSEVKGLETINHEGPSIIGIDTIYRSKGNIPYKFLLDAGIPKDDIVYLLRLAGKAIDFYSCFISYSSQDQDFAERLHADLQAKGVRCWFASHDMKPGEVIITAIDKAIRGYDKLLLILSKDSVASKWMRHEVEKALTEEMRIEREGNVLFPIRLDNTVMTTEFTWANSLRQSRHIGDFTQWKDHDTYQKAFDKLLHDLKMEAEK